MRISLFTVCMSVVLVLGACKKPHNMDSRTLAAGTLSNVMSLSKIDKTLTAKMNDSSKLSFHRVANMEAYQIHVQLLKTSDGKLPEAGEVVPCQLLLVRKDGAPISITDSQSKRTRKVCRKSYFEAFGVSGNLATSATCRSLGSELIVSVGPHALGAASAPAYKPWLADLPPLDGGNCALDGGALPVVAVAPNVVFGDGLVALKKAQDFSSVQGEVFYFVIHDLLQCPPKGQSGACSYAVAK